jgi:hypothetical protein
LCVVILAEAAVIAAVVYKLYTLGVKVLAFEESVEDCLDHIEKAYQETYAITRTNDSLTSDPRLHIAVKSLRGTRVALMSVASILSSEFEQKDEAANSKEESVK